MLEIEQHQPLSFYASENGTGPLRCPDGLEFCQGEWHKFQANNTQKSMVNFALSHLVSEGEPMGGINVFLTLCEGEVCECGRTKYHTDLEKLENDVSGHTRAILITEK